MSILVKWHSHLLNDILTIEPINSIEAVNKHDNEQGLHSSSAVATIEEVKKYDNEQRLHSSSLVLFEGSQCKCMESRELVLVEEVLNIWL